MVVRGVKAQLLGEVVAGRNCAQEACKVRGRVEREVRRKPEEELEERRQRERVRVRERRERKRRWEEWERQRAERAVEEVKKEEARIRALKSIHEEVDELQASFKATIGESAWHNIWGYPSTGLPPWVFDLRGHWKTFLSGMPWAYFIENIENEQDWKEGMTRWWARQLDDVIARELRVFVPDVPRAGSFLNGAPTAHDIALVAALGGREMEMERWEGRFKNVYTRFAVAELGGLRVEVGDGDVLGREDGWQKVRGRKVDEACVLRG